MEGLMASDSTNHPHALLVLEEVQIRHSPFTPSMVRFPKLGFLHVIWKTNVQQYKLRTSVVTTTGSLTMPADQTNTTYKIKSNTSLTRMIFVAHNSLKMSSFPGDSRVQNPSRCSG